MHGSRTIPMVLAALALAAAPAACKKPHDPANPEEMKEKLAKGVKYGLWKVDGTDEQKRQFDELLDGLSVDLFAVQQDSKALVRRTMDALESQDVDAQALERIQAEGDAVFDRYMKRMLRAATDASKILTPDQRRKVVGLWRDWEFGD